jgi:hypothetical protein
MAYKPQDIIVRNFSGGIADSTRKVSPSEFAISKHFDIFTDAQKLTPYRSLEADTNDGSTATGMKQYFVRDFFYASQSAKLYGLGQTGAGLTKIVYKDDATTGNWTLPASSEGNGAVKNGCFFEYKDYAWGFQGTNQIFKWGLLSGTPTITNTATGGTVGATITSVAQGVVHNATGYAYLFYNNVIVRLQPDLTITDSARTVPDDLKITSVTNIGSYLAIGCSPKSSFNGNSKVFLWDGSSDLFAETIDWGEGELRVLEFVEGILIGVTDRYLNNSTGAGRGSMIIQTYSGSSAQVLKEVFTQALTGKSIPIQKSVKNNRLFWSAKIMTNSAGTEYVEGIWSFGRKNANFPYTMTLDIIDENVNTSGIQGFGTASNFFFIAHSADGSIDKTNDAATYAFTSSYDSLIYDLGDPTLEKQLNTFTVYTVSLPSGSSVTVKYRFDDDTSYTTIGTYSTLGGHSRDFINIESTGDAFPSFREAQFRIESTGGAEIVGYKIKATPLIGLS